MLTVGPVENFKDHSQFTNLKDFNNNIEMFLAIHKKEFTRTEFMLFRRLTKFAAKVPGVATASIRKLLQGVILKDFAFGASESTFHRMRRKAVKLGILEVHTVLRKNESQSSNLWIFKRFDKAANFTKKVNNDTPPVTTEQPKTAPVKRKIFSQMTPLKTGVSSKTSSLNITKRIGTAAMKDDPKNSSLDHSFTGDYVPKEFVMTVKPFFNDAETIEEYWKMAKISSYDYRNAIDPETVLSLAMHSFKQMIGKLKKGKAENPVAYFTGVLKRQLSSVLEEMIEADPSPKRGNGLFNWLEN